MVLGIDEVGRGSLAGPLVIGAVSLRKPIKGLRDSKLLTPAKRTYFSEPIEQYALVASLGWVSASEIDSLGLSAAMILAIDRAIENIHAADYEIVIDGNINYLKHMSNSRCLIKADQTIPEVSAASILAKVARDKYMISLSSKYPKYDFKSNVGYGTKSHIQAIARHGLSDIHRKSFKLKLA